jgi:hypothetical protein
MSQKSKKTLEFELSPEQQEAYEKYLREWDKLTADEQGRQRRKSRADSIAPGLPNVSAALIGNASKEGIADALEKDKWAQTRDRIVGVQEQAAVILNLLLSKNDRVSFSNMGDVWKPERQDFHDAFVDGADEAYEAYHRLWRQTPVPLPNQGQTQLLIQGSTPELISEARLFPSGYNQCVHRFSSETIWIAWKFIKPGESLGMAYNGLAWLGDRFKWFPKPWRMWPE